MTKPNVKIRLLPLTGPAQIRHLLHYRSGRPTSFFKESCCLPHKMAWQCMMGIVHCRLCTMPFYTAPIAQNASLCYSIHPPPQIGKLCYGRATARTSSI